MKTALEAAEIIRAGADRGACNYALAMDDLLAYWQVLGAVARGVPESVLEARDMRRRMPDERTRSDMSVIGQAVGRGLANLLHNDPAA
jgi:hypothetical protein